MHVIVGAANLDRNSAGADDDSAEVLPKSRANVIRDLRYPVLGAVDQVVVKARERLGHVTPWRGVVPGVSPLATIGRRSAAANCILGRCSRGFTPGYNRSPLRGYICFVAAPRKHLLGVGTFVPGVKPLDRYSSGTRCAACICSRRSAKYLVSSSADLIVPGSRCRRNRRRGWSGRRRRDG